MRNKRNNLWIVVWAVALAWGTAVAADGGLDTPADVFARLKTMQGSWAARAELVAGEPETGHEGELESRHDFRVSGAGSVVMEVMGAGSDHEMINMYHMDGADLVLTHYCAGGNQPTMRLDGDALARGAVEFSFTGGTNLDPATDPHIHSAAFHWQDDGRVRADWASWSAGREDAVMRFLLTRAE